MARIAVVGSGIAGLGAAWALARRHEVVVFEAESRPGGHASTVEVTDGGRSLAVDTGFIVHNRLNYPNLVALFEALGVPTRESEMSFSVSIAEGRYEYGSSPAGYLAQPWNALRPATWRMLRDLSRLGRAAERPEVLASREPVGPWLRREGYSRAFVDRMLLPMTAAIWSAGIDGIEAYPVGSMLAFMRNHGLLGFRDRPVWRTVVGGSREYVRRVVEALGSDAVRLGARVVAVLRDDAGVTVRVDGRADERFDHVVLATHADHALAILGPDATAAEREVLGAFRFQRNVAVLHRDDSFLPRRRRARASWNYLAERLRQPGAVSLTYWMNRLQGLETEEPVLVTLNPSRPPSGWSRSFTYEHPQYDAAAIAAQERIGEVQGARRTWFAGAWLGHGFHEDGLRSGLAVAAALGSPAPWQQGAVRMSG
ncbi:MAG: NAD(P)/FAD-dependent oxidoreductase [Actinomycetota bacterium]